jgi:hypothetical protein
VIWWSAIMTAGLKISYTCMAILYQIAKLKCAKYACKRDLELNSQILISINISSHVVCKSSYLILYG